MPQFPSYIIKTFLTFYKIYETVHYKEISENVDLQWYSKLHHMKPDLWPNFLSYPKKTVIILIRLRTGQSRITHIFLEDALMCLHCHFDLCTIHYL